MLPCGKSYRTYRLRGPRDEAHSSLLRMWQDEALPESSEGRTCLRWMLVEAAVSGGHMLVLRKAEAARQQGWESAFVLVLPLQVGPAASPMPNMRANRSISAWLVWTHYHSQRDAARSPERCVRCDRIALLRKRDKVCRNCALDDHFLQQGRERLTAVIGGTVALKHPQLELLYRHLTAPGPAKALRRWIGDLSPKIVAYLKAVGEGGQITAESIDALATEAGGRELRDYCYGAGILERPRVQEYRIEAILARVREEEPRWISLLLDQYWTFHLRPLVRQRQRRVLKLDPTLESDRMLLTHAAAFAGVFARSGSIVAALDQDFIDRYVTDTSVACRTALRRFVHWLRATRCVAKPLEVPIVDSQRHRALSRLDLLSILHRARTDETLTLEVRAALLILILCMRHVVECVRLTSTSIKRFKDGSIEIAFLKGVSAPLAGDDARIILQWAKGKTHGLFPSRQRLGAAMTAETLSRHIQDAGIGVKLGDLRAAAELNSANSATPRKSFAPWAIRVHRSAAFASAGLPCPAASSGV